MKPRVGLKGLAAVSALLGAGLTMGLAAAPASATSILMNQGSTTLDPATGLEWLDLTLTAGQSYDAVAAGYGGYTTGGWKYATRDQVAQLFTDAGGSGVYPEDAATAGNNTTFDAALALSLLLGATFNTDDSAGFEFAGKGLISDAPDPTAHFYAEFVGVLIYDSNIFVGNLNTSSLSGPLNNLRDSTIGSFLVRSTLATTPIPPALPLFASAIGALGLFRWRKARAHSPAAA